jgi:CheY-like chemotaxis protein
MDAQTLATLVLAEMSRSADAPVARATLAAACAASDSDIDRAITLLLDLGLIEEQDGAVRARGRAASTTRPVLLIVENTAAVAHVAAALLESEGYGVLLSSTLLPAEKALRVAPIALVIADSYAPTARAAIARLQPLRERAGTAPVLLFTAHRDLDSAEAVANGFAGLLPKPFDIDELLALVREALGQTNG